MAQTQTRRPQTQDAMVVILEDDGATCELYQLILEHQGFRIGVFSDQDQCCEYIRTHRPDVLIFDVLGLVQNGLTVLYNLYHEMGSDMPPVIIATALHHNQICNHPAFRQLPQVRTLHKPFDIHEMVSAVQASIFPPHIVVGA